MAAPLSLVGFSGSLRAGSHNTALLRTVQAMLPADVTLEILDWRDVPVFNEDLEVGEPPRPASVTRIREAVRASDGIIIATPEYNHGVPGGLKNLIDWLSRGPMPHGFFGIPSAILGASNGMIGTTRAQYHLRQTLVALNSPTLPAPQVLVSNADVKFTDGALVHDATRQFVAGWIAEMARWMRRFPKSER